LIFEEIINGEKMSGSKLFTACISFNKAKQLNVGFIQLSKPSTFNLQLSTFNLQP
jgi:hypothetical protein